MKKFLFIFLLLFFFTIRSSSVLAACLCDLGPVNYNETTCLSHVSDQGCSWSDDSSGGSSNTVKLDNPLPNVTSPQVLIGNIIKAAMGIIGSLALAMFIFGGVLWMTSAGNAERVTKGKQTIIWATIGMIVIFAAYAVVNFIITSLG